MYYVYFKHSVLRILIARAHGAATRDGAHCVSCAVLLAAIGLTIYVYHFDGV
jgi:hypothetical protein